MHNSIIFIKAWMSLDHILFWIILNAKKSVPYSIRAHNLPAFKCFSVIKIEGRFLVRGHGNNYEALARCVHKLLHSIWRIHVSFYSPAVIWFRSF